MAVHGNPGGALDNALFGSMFSSQFVDGAKRAFDGILLLLRAGGNAREWQRQRAELIAKRAKQGS